MDNPVTSLQQATLSFSQSLETISQALHTLATTIPLAIHQAAELGLLRETHDLAQLRSTILGEQQLASEDHQLLLALQQKIDSLVRLSSRLDTQSTH